MSLERFQPDQLLATSSVVGSESESYIFSDTTPSQKCETFSPHSPAASMLPARRSKRSASCESLRSEPSTLMRFLSKPNRHLQLPSFEALGIAIPSPRSISRTATKERLKQVSSPLPEISRSTTRVSTPAACLSCTALNITGCNPYSSSLPLTPPDDIECVSWSPTSRVSNFAAARIPTPQPASHAEVLTTRRPSHSNSQSDGPTMSLRQATPSNRAIDGGMSFAGDNLQNDENVGSWLSNSIAAAVSHLPVSKNWGEAVQVVSQTLPCPSPDSSDSLSPVAAFGPIVQAIQCRLQPGQSPYINITHAVPPKFSLTSLPTSPPSTPNILFPGDDYFNLTVFSSATPVPAYGRHDPKGPCLSGSPFGQGPIVPPYSVHVAVVERYLPPSSPREYRDFFSARGPSVLVDRLLELSPKGGSLLFIYPTKTGAQTFKANYLGPILDPLLRQLVVVNGLSADVGMALGQMTAISHMDDFENMQSNIQRLCSHLGRRESSPSQSGAATSSHTSCATGFSLIHACKREVTIDRKLWAEWYIQQETPRVRDVLNEYWRNGYRFPSNNATALGSRTPGDREVTCAMLLREILDGIRKRPYVEGSEPCDGLELGVFVIRRSQ